MNTRDMALSVGLTLLLASSLAACGQASPPTATAVPSNAGPVPSDGPSDRPSATVVSVAPSEAPTTSVKPTPTPRERLVRWSTKPHVIFEGDCSSVVATIDDSSRFHVAGRCSGGIGYATSTDAKTWKSSTLAPPADVSEVDPQLAADGSTLYLAYTRLRPVEQDTCSGGFVNEDPAGIYYRTRTLPSGRWSKPTRFRGDGDHLQSFRVVDGVIHATFRGDRGNGVVSYASSMPDEIAIPGAASTSLRVGDDGRPRIAFTGGGSVGYAVVTGSGRLKTTTIFSADDVEMGSPVLVLGADDRAFVSWAAWPLPECDAPKPTHDGTWFATDVDGAWAVKRLSKDIGAASLVVDVATGRLYATYNDRRGVRYVTRAGDGTWSGSRPAFPDGFEASVIRRDPASGRLVLVGSQTDGDVTRTYAMTAS